MQAAIRPGFVGTRSFLASLLFASACGVSGNVSNGTTGGTTESTTGATAAAATSSTAAATGSTAAATASGSTGRATTTGHSGASTSSGGHSGTTAASATASTTTGGTTGTTGGTTGTTGGTTGGFLGVLQRSNDLARDAVFVDSAFIKATISASGSLTQDSTFNPAGWNGPVFASPLYFVDSALGKDLVIVATDDNEVFALDAADGSTVWSITQLVAPITNAELGEFGCQGNGSIGPPIGITSTPVIDPASRTLYLNALTSVNGTPEHEIFALDLDNGTTRAGWPVNANTVSTVLTDGTTLKFDSSLQWQRGGLTLVNGTLYVGYGGIDGDCGAYHGWVIAVQTANPSAVTAYATDVQQAGIWGPSGLASDGTSLYVATGNGDTGSESSTWLGGEAVLRLGAGATFSNQTTDYFYPSNYVTLDGNDEDLGSTGPVLFDFNDTGGVKHLVWEMGKTDNAILLDQANLGGQEGELSAPQVAPTDDWLFGSLAAYHTSIATYVIYNGPYTGPGTCPNGSGDTAALIVNPTSGSTPITATVGWCATLGGTAAPIVSTTDGTTDAVVWGLGNGLTALDGDTGVPLASVSVPGSYSHWVTPIIAKGRLFVVGNNSAWAFLP